MTALLILDETYTCAVCRRAQVRVSVAGPTPKQLGGNRNRSLNRRGWRSRRGAWLCPSCASRPAARSAGGPVAAPRPGRPIARGPLAGAQVDTVLAQRAGLLRTRAAMARLGCVMQHGTCFRHTGAGHEWERRWVVNGLCPAAVDAVLDAASAQARRGRNIASAPRHAA